VSDQNNRSARLRHTAAGALAALAAVGGIAGATALAENPPAKAPGYAAAANSGPIKTPAAGAGAIKTPSPGVPAPAKSRTPQPGSNQPFLTAVQRLVDDGTISATQGRAVDREIQAASFDPQTLSGFTPTQLQAVGQALANTKRSLAAQMH
jgi:hypothetical protein